MLYCFFVYSFRLPSQQVNRLFAFNFWDVENRPKKPENLASQPSKIVVSVMTLYRRKNEVLWAHPSSLFKNKWTVGYVNFHCRCRCNAWEWACLSPGGAQLAHEVYRAASKGEVITTGICTETQRVYVKTKTFPYYKWHISRIVGTDIKCVALARHCSFPKFGSSFVSISKLCCEKPVF